MMSVDTSNSAISHIAEENVRAALDSLVLCSTSRPVSPLQALFLVDRFMVRSGLSDTSYNREFALSKILVNIITDELTRHRLLLGMLPPPEASLDDVEEAIHRDIKCSNPQLFDWSCLYYHYVRTDLNMLLADVARIAHTDARTVRRYRQRGIRRLTYLLIEQEAQISRERRMLSLRAALPSVSPPQLFGRGQACGQAMEFLSGLPPYHIQVVGPAGIGKTALVQEILRLLVNQNRLDDLIWIDTPRSTSQIRTQLKLSQDVVYERMSSQRVAVVLDNADYLVFALKALSTLLTELGNAIVFVTARCPLPLSYQSKCLHLSELEQADAWTLIRSVLDWYYVERAPAVTDNEIAAVWESAGGNPGKIQQLVFKRRNPHLSIPRRCTVRPNQFD